MSAARHVLTDVRAPAAARWLAYHGRTCASLEHRRRPDCCDT